MPGTAQRAKSGNMSSLRSLKPQLALLFSVMLWSTAFVAIRSGLSAYSPGSLSLLRFMVASLCFIPPFLASTKRRLRLNEVGCLAVVGLVGIATYSVLLNSGERIVPAGVASFIVSQTPVLTAILAVLFLRERIDLITVLGIVISTAGVTLIVVGERVQVDFSLGLMLVAIAACCGSLHSVFQKPLLNRLPIVQVIAYSNWTATLPLLIFLPGLMREMPHASIEASAAAVYLGLVPAALAQWFWAYGLKNTSVVHATIYIYTMPIFATLFGWLLLAETPSAYSLVGGLIALLGAAIVRKDIFGFKVKLAQRNLP
jgi:drug/metabolite transporter (DMT)-like permease